ncbi:MAG TPA: pyridoxamine 5'-phosphate oxidase [Chthoniobacterales bacterium]|jgi:pyridoxamine 5'-phosphate oxidase|nr:pyridoxamine 5'-phosphate oxidase [Chthoniobacterales bacterium]
MDETPLSQLSGLRHEYDAHGLRRADLHSDPLEQFRAWFAAAIAADIRDVNAMSLATATPEGKPSVRIVLLKGVDERGFSFFTNYDSEKGRDLTANPYAALCFYWVKLERQIRISGPVERTSREDSAAYFHSRPAGSRLGAWVSKQSEIIDSRKILDARLEEMKERFEDGEISLPPHWGGYRVKPEQIEFWQGRPNRLHDRFRYSLRADGTWQIDRLAP